MNKHRNWLIAAIIVLVGGAVLGVPRAWRWFEAPPAGHCPICLRHEHKESMVQFQADGEPVTDACCLSCALTYGRQTHKHIRIVSVTDHETGKALAPEKAVFVVGSDVSPCAHSMVHVGEEKQEYAVRWDRCLPSILAFSSPELAEAFRAQHGGRVQTLGELMLARQE